MNPARGPHCSRRLVLLLSPPAFVMPRLDQALVERGLCESREKAKRAIMAGRVSINQQHARKPSDPVQPRDRIALQSGEKYVSRGGHKLEHALNHFHLNVEGLTAVDLGEVARAVLEQNWCGSWTCPSTAVYSHQWLWDSCFIAIGVAKRESYMLDHCPRQHACDGRPASRAQGGSEFWRICAELPELQRIPHPFGGVSQFTAPSCAQ